MSEKACVVLLGASNLSLGFPDIVEEIARRSPAPFDVLAAHGFGRSYGMPTNVFGRRLGSLKESELWSVLEQRAPQRIHALVTDVGNDIAYGNSIDDLERWVAEVLERLTVQGANVIATGLPLASVEGVPPWIFGLFRRAFFPRRNTPRAVLIERAREMNERVERLAKQHGAAFVSPSADWYVLDPIHIAGNHRSRAWQKMLEPWTMGAERKNEIQLSFSERVALRRNRCKTRTIFGSDRGVEQPWMRLRSGSEIGLY